MGKLHPSQVPGGAGALLSLFPFCIHGSHQPGRPQLAPSLLALVNSGSASLWVPSKRQVNSPRMRRGPGAAAGEANFGQFQIGPCIAAMATLVRKKKIMLSDISPELGLAFGFAADWETRVQSWIGTPSHAPSLVVVGLKILENKICLQNFERGRAGGGLGERVLPFCRHYH